MRRENAVPGASVIELTIPYDGKPPEAQHMLTQRGARASFTRLANCGADTRHLLHRLAAMVLLEAWIGRLARGHWANVSSRPHTKSYWSVKRFPGKVREVAGEIAAINSHPLLTPSVFGDNSTFTKLPQMLRQYSDYLELRIAEAGPMAQDMDRQLRTLPKRIEERLADLVPEQATMRDYADLATMINAAFRSYGIAKRNTTALSLRALHRRSKTSPSTVQILEFRWDTESMELTLSFLETSPPVFPS